MIRKIALCLGMVFVLSACTEMNEFLEVTNQILGGSNTATSTSTSSSSNSTSVAPVGAITPMEQNALVMARGLK